MSRLSIVKLVGQRCRAQCGLKNNNSKQSAFAIARAVGEPRVGTSGAPVASILHQIACPRAGGTDPPSTRARSGTRSVPGRGWKSSPKHFQAIRRTAPPHPEEHRRLLLRGRVHGQRLHTLRSCRGSLSSRAHQCAPGQVTLPRGTMTSQPSAGKRGETWRTGNVKLSEAARASWWRLKKTRGDVSTARLPLEGQP